MNMKGRANYGKLGRVARMNWRNKGQGNTVDRGTKGAGRMTVRKEGYDKRKEE